MLGTKPESNQAMLPYKPLLIRLLKVFPAEKSKKQQINCPFYTSISNANLYLIKVQDNHSKSFVYGAGHSLVGYMTIASD